MNIQTTKSSWVDLLVTFLLFVGFIVASAPLFVHLWFSVFPSEPTRAEMIQNSYEQANRDE